MQKKTLILLSVGLALMLCAGGGAAWWWLRPHAEGAQAEAPKPKPGPEPKYVSLDKVLVMLRPTEGQAARGAHYLAVDVVFKVLPENEKRTKDQLAFLRTVAVKALSSYELQAVSAMSVEQVAEVLNKAYADSYEAEHREPPFAEALIGKLIIE